MSSFARLATIEASTKRSPAMTASGRGEPETYLDCVLVTPLDPADSARARDLALRLRQETGAPFEILECFTESANDVREGDVLVVDGRAYAVRGVDPWRWRSSSYLALLLEDLR